MNAFTSKTALLAETPFCSRSSLSCPPSLGLNQRLHSPSESVRSSPLRFELSGAFCCLLLLKISNCIHNSRETRKFSRTKGVAERAEEEVLQVSLGSYRCLSREPARGLPHSQLVSSLILCFSCFRRMIFLLIRVGNLL